MRFLAAALYVLLTFVRSWLGQRLTTGAMERFQKRRSVRSLGGWLIGAALILVLFAQYYLLTGSFPTMFVCLLVVIVIVVDVLVSLLRAALGLDSQEKARKVNFLTFLWGATTPKAVQLILGGYVICFLLWPIVVLWMFFSSYPTQLEREIQISIYHFCIPAIAGQLVITVLNWRSIVSEDVDDDLRSASFLVLLTLGLTTTIIVLYPAYLVGSSATLSLVSPGIWILLSMPTLIFVFGAVLPYVTGTFRHKAQMTGQIQWTRDWISKLTTNLHAAPTETRRRERDQLVNALEQRIRDKFDENQLFSFLQNDRVAWREEMSARTPALLTDQSGQDETNAGETPTGTALVRNDDAAGSSGILHDIRRAREAIRHTTPILPPGQAKQQERLRAFVHEEGANLLVWDASMKHVDQLLGLREEVEEFEQKRATETGLSGYLEVTDKELGRLDADVSAKRRKRSLSTLLAAATGACAQVLIASMSKPFESQIGDFFGRIIGLN